jgi:hypothetical protein
LVTDPRPRKQPPERSADLRGGIVIAFVLAPRLMTCCLALF